MSARTSPILLIAALAATSPVAADEKKLTTDEIKQAFDGNSIHGMWGDTEYYSYFDPSGFTDYATKGGTDRGHWRAAHDQYCSKWQMSGESCYDILRDGDRIIWIVPSTGKRYESDLIAGRASPAFQ